MFGIKNTLILSDREYSKLRSQIFSTGSTVEEGFEINVKKSSINSTHIGKPTKAVTKSHFWY
jgi:hypothetical protein